MTGCEHAHVCHPPDRTARRCSGDERACAVQQDACVVFLEAFTAAQVCQHSHCCRVGAAVFRLYAGREGLSFDEGQAQRDTSGVYRKICNSLEAEKRCQRGPIAPGVLSLSYVIMRSGGVEVSIANNVSPHLGVSHLSREAEGARPAQTAARVGVLIVECGLSSCSSGLGRRGRLAASGSARWAWGSGFWR